MTIVTPGRPISHRHHRALMGLGPRGTVRWPLLVRAVVCCVQAKDTWTRITDRRSQPRFQLHGSRQDVMQS